MCSLSPYLSNKLQSYSCSGKLVALKFLIEKFLCMGEFANSNETASRCKIVIFSQKPRCLEIIASQLLALYSDIHYLTVTSELSAEKRMEYVENFQSDWEVSILLATTGICGHGFSLTAASVVILVDHNFNPYVDIQAIDRCHRIGQENAVMVYRLVSNEPNEERLMKYFCVYSYHVVYKGLRNILLQPSLRLTKGIERNLH